MTTAPSRSTPRSTGGTITCRPAHDASERAEHHRIRHSVFVTEQRIFATSDRDEYDDGPRTVHLIGRYADIVAGAVRLFPLDEAGVLWQGDRLCVLPEFRIHGLGGPLVRCAVALAGAFGGTRMVAHIQLPNVRFFEHLGWATDGPVEIYAGVDHQPMAIDLPDRAAGARAAEILATGAASPTLRR